MNAIDIAQAGLNKRFRYARDRGDRWRILRSPGIIYGDCEDYSLTLAWLMSGQSIIKFWINILTCRYVIWHCHSPSGNPHAVMWVRGEGWTDNIMRIVVTRQYLKSAGYKLWFPWLGPLAAVKFAITFLTGK